MIFINFFPRQNDPSDDQNSTDENELQHQNFSRGASDESERNMERNEDVNPLELNGRSHSLDKT